MIEKLQEGEFREAKITEKLNELIDAFNELVEDFNTHYHSSSNDDGGTSGPIVDVD